MVTERKEPRGYVCLQEEDTVCVVVDPEFLLFGGESGIPAEIKYLDQVEIVSAGETWFTIILRTNALHKKQYGSAVNNLLFGLPLAHKIHKNWQGTIPVTATASSDGFADLDDSEHDIIVARVERHLRSQYPECFPTI